jgi:hypothetical protein
MECVAKTYSDVERLSNQLDQLKRELLITRKSAKETQIRRFWFANFSVLLLRAELGL